MKAYVNMSDYAVNERNKQALDDLVWRVMENEKNAPIDLCEFLAEQTDLPELMTRAVLTKGLPLWATDEIEKRLRAYLADSKFVEDRAEELASEE